MWWSLRGSDQLKDSVAVASPWVPLATLAGDPTTEKLERPVSLGFKLLQPKLKFNCIEIKVSCDSSSTKFQVIVRLKM